MADASTRERPTPPWRRRAEGRAPAAGFLSGPAAVRAVRALLWGLAGLAAVGGMAAIVSSPSRTTQSAAEEIPSPGVGGVAEVAVHRWLATPREAVVGVDRSSRAGGNVTSAHAVAARLVADRYWAVTVAVEVERPHGQALWFFEIGVVEGPRGPAVAGAPAVVPPPGRIDIAPPSRLGSVSGVGDEVSGAVQAFLDALLTARGDLTRYLAPGVHVAPISPAFDAVRLTGLSEVAGADERKVVQAQAVASAGDLQLDVAYELVLEHRGGRWEVASLSAARALRRPSRASSTTATTAPASAVPSSAAPASPVPGA